MLVVGEYYNTKDGIRVLVTEKAIDAFLIINMNDSSNWWADERGRFLRLNYNVSHCCDIVVPSRKYKRSR